MLIKIKQWASRLKLEITAIYIASKDARTPPMAKLLAIGVAAYAFSPIDLIPDFIPVLGLLDDLIIVPAGIALIVKLIPKDLMTIFRHDAKAKINPSSNWHAAIFIVTLWLAIAVIVVHITLI